MEIHSSRYKMGPVDTLKTALRGELIRDRVEAQEAADHATGALMDDSNLLFDAIVLFQLAPPFLETRREAARGCTLEDAALDDGLMPADPELKFRAQSWPSHDLEGDYVELCPETAPSFSIEIESSSSRGVLTFGPMQESAHALPRSHRDKFNLYLAMYRQGSMEGPVTYPMRAQPAYFQGTRRMPKSYLVQISMPQSMEVARQGGYVPRAFGSTYCSVSLRVGSGESLMYVNAERVEANIVALRAEDGLIQTAIGRALTSNINPDNGVYYAPQHIQKILGPIKVTPPQLRTLGVL